MAFSRPYSISKGVFDNDSWTACNLALEIDRYNNHIYGYIINNRINLI